MDKPTERAESYFRLARDNFMMSAGKFEGIESIPWHSLAMGLYALVNGLMNLAVGLRATYLKLEQVEALIKRQGGPSRN